LLHIIIVTIGISVFLQSAPQKHALAYLNQIRQQAGMIVLQPNKRLNRAAKAHAKYLLRQQKFGHFEKKGWRGYTGKTPSERVVHAGYSSKAVMENVSVNARTYRQSIDTLFSAIYHRFVFLNFDKNEIGMGNAFGRGRKRKVVSSFVYLFGSKEVSRLCQNVYPLENGTFYINDLCRDASRMVPQSLYAQKRKAVQKQNPPLVCYPCAGAKDIPTVFYTEHPHPLPGSKESGYPVSVAFNPAFYSHVTLKKFRLLDREGKEVKPVKILTSHNDVNHRFTPLQFALMPLKRLKYAQQYRVEFEAVAKGEKIKKQWQFRTRKRPGR